MKGRYEIVVETYFSSAHNLRGYEGDCERLHGHNWRVEVAVEGKKLDSIGLLVDFRALKKLVRSVVDSLDHTYLNEHPVFTKMNPSTENLGRFIAEQVAKGLPKNVRVSWVRVWEGPATRATFFPD